MLSKNMLENVWGLTTNERTTFYFYIPFSKSFQIALKEKLLQFQTPNGEVAQRQLNQGEKNEVCSLQS